MDQHEKEEFPIGTVGGQKRSNSVLLDAGRAIGGGRRSAVTSPRLE